MKILGNEETKEINLWPDWTEGKCEICGEICVNQFLEKYGCIVYRWRAKYWKENVICTCCVDDLTDEEKDKLK
jgi:hypothetical protein